MHVNCSENEKVFYASDKKLSLERDCIENFMDQACLFFAPFGFQVLCMFWLGILTFLLVPHHEKQGFSFSDFFQKFAKMCFQKYVSGPKIRCCEEKSYVGEVCVDKVIEICRQPNSVACDDEQPVDYSGVQMIVIVGILLLFIWQRFGR